MSSVLSCRQVSKSYRDGDHQVEVLQGLDLEIQKQEQVAIVGSSGSGKSTLLHILGTLDKPTSGELHINGTNVFSLSQTKLADFRNTSLGFIYQFHHLLMEFTALENVAMPLLIRGESVEHASEKAKDLLVRVGLGHRLTHRPSEMSGGERQRVSIARAVITSPALVLADEPTGNLDGHSASEVYGLLCEINQEFDTAIIVVTHDLRLAGKLDKCYQLVEGKLGVMG